MAVLSTHTLDSVSGNSAINVRVQLFRLLGDCEKELVFDTRTNQEGRLSETFESSGAAAEDYELVFHSGDYLGQKNLQEENPVICLLYTSPSPRDRQKSRMPSSA